MAVMFGGLLPGYPAGGAQRVIQVTFTGHTPTVSGINVFTITSGFAATRRQTVELKTL